MPSLLSFNLAARCLWGSACLMLLASTAHANNCEPIRAKIEAQIRDAGVERFSVTVLPNDTPANGKVVGSCDNGQQKIIYTRGVPAADAPASSKPAAASPTQSAEAARPPARRAQRPTPEAEILTECRDGSVSVGGRCGR